MATSGMETRSCGACTLCCRLPEIELLSKPANAPCVNCVTGQGCRIYDDRPDLCRDFLCAWMTDDELGAEWDPTVAKMMVYGQGKQLTVLVDPDHPLSWREEPYAAQLGSWATAAADDGGYVIVFVGDDVHKIVPAISAAKA
ncbi:hypothetical protein [Rhizobium sp. AN80A]|uniref:YkgJ family cysteine cluster protein n=1 Tax=Rhizobium sp. AN80A TaxID=3040673 RepID=UPI0024B3B5F8|nr:hypothetical protein [Rhizobium sp. AN80A]